LRWIIEVDMTKELIDSEATTGHYEYLRINSLKYKIPYHRTSEKRKGED
jgi:hypothetical protein